ncbi:glycoside hydrolase family 3 protein [Paenibacillus sp. S150]|uniref:glycoside hydrolase family 3 protein n=1 Tax=Paenibacillus sp. S150 TaxID=2749826 RepID=UPI001C583F25|nr:glycoside hydrolase family 3 N-terminal domain-containing protein [Paenibacillus sp. S150]MBW4081000.1 glycoside hydrolase family 3 protein [Paenibacillus sp. S150]
MVDLQSKPFHLSPEDIRWVHSTLASMDLDSKLGQLLFPVGSTTDRTELVGLLNGIKPSGFMFPAGPAAERQELHRFLQERSELPLLLAANLEFGGNGIAKEGTFFAKPMQVAATDDGQQAYRLGLTAGREGAGVGVNWTFAPIVDIDYNPRNPITNTRTFGSDPERVARMALGYARGIWESGLAVSVKHFPGDGVDDRDQHLGESINSLPVEEWEGSYGQVYRKLIEAGAETIMVGHIKLPAYSRHLRPGLADEHIMPATLAPELLGPLLRERLGFNGLVLTDASTMAGFMIAEKRSVAVPGTIAAGCDILLFSHNIEEDFSYLREAVRDGRLSLERVEEAVTRILALKASLGLHRRHQTGTLVPEPAALAVIGLKQHTEWARECADLSVTLVRDTNKLLPIDPVRQKRVLLVVIGDEGRRQTLPDRYKLLVDKLEREHFLVTLLKEQESWPNKQKLSIAELQERFDWALYFVNLETDCTMPSLRIHWSPPMGTDLPWFAQELPTVFLSVANPYHHAEVPRSAVLINGYSGNVYVIEAAMDKILGRSKFKGIHPVNPFD